MASAKNIWFMIIGAFFLISACQDDKGKNDYSGVSDLISERNNARYELSDRVSKKTENSRKEIDKKVQKPLSEDDERQKELMSIILYEEKVKIVSTDSGRILAKGVAAVNKNGEIVRIKIVKEE